MSLQVAIPDGYTISDMNINIYRHDEEDFILTTDDDLRSVRRHDYEGSGYLADDWGDDGDDGDSVSSNMLQRLVNQPTDWTGNLISPTIYKVPDRLRQENPRAYEPEHISIGPVHYNSNEKLYHMEDVKWRYLRAFLIRQFQPPEAIDKYVKAGWRIEKEARAHYSVKIDLEPSQFVEMLVLDGCFILEFLIRYSLDKYNQDPKWSLPMLRNDLLLLENQIPFFVLEILFEKSEIKFEFTDANTLFPFDPDKFTTLLRLTLFYIGNGRVGKMTSLKNREICHLLHLSYLYELNSFDPSNVVNNSPSTVTLHRMKRLIREPLVSCCYLMVSLLLMCKSPHGICFKRKRNRRFPRTLPSAEILKESGIKFKMKKQDTGKECFLNVSFRKEDGTIEIPFLPVQPDSASFFRNPIALDLLPHFTAYAFFMDMMIDTPEDVAILVKQGIIERKFGSNEDVATFFNNIAKGATFDPRSHYLANLFRGVREYCDSDIHRWRFALINRYFNNPWAVASLIAAIILLLMTIIATGATAVQTLYTVKGYTKQFN